LIKNGCFDRFCTNNTLIAGTDPNLYGLKKDVEKYGLKDFVQFLDFVPEDEIRGLHKAGDIFVMHNRILDDGDREGFGIVFLDASASGKPVIGGRGGGAVEAVEDGVTGYTVNPYETDDLVEKVTFLLANPDKAEAIGKEGME
jgi:phosphatidylinositol alpha-1,6-mannosyltransferase